MPELYISLSWSSQSLWGLGWQWQLVARLITDFDLCTGSLQKLCWGQDCHPLWNPRHDGWRFKYASTRHYYQACDPHSVAQPSHLWTYTHGYLLHSNNKFQWGWPALRRMLFLCPWHNLAFEPHYPTLKMLLSTLTRNFRSGSREDLRGFSWSSPRQKSRPLYHRGHRTLRRAFPWSLI